MSHHDRCAFPCARCRRVAVDVGALGHRLGWQEETQAHHVTIFSIQHCRACICLAHVPRCAFPPHSGSAGDWAVSPKVSPSPRTPVPCTFLG